MSIKMMQQVIEDGVQQELQQQNLLRYFAEQPSLLQHSALSLIRASSAEQLVEFVSRYVQHVPIFMQAIMDLAEQAGIEQFLSPVIAVAEGFFQQPPLQNQQHSGLSLLLDEAYLAHRLFEEINDIYLHFSGHTLLPLDTSQANLFVHSLIGEPFANELDAAVLSTIEQLNRDHDFEKNAEFIQHIESIAGHQLSKLWQDWPCFLSYNIFETGPAH